MPKAQLNRDAAIGGAVGGFFFLLCLVGAAAALIVRRRRQARPVWDVFLSYRRLDALVVDSFADKAKLCGMRVFHDRSGAMAGHAFESELFQAVKSSVAFTPVITLAAIRGFGAAGLPSAPVDWMLVECLMALHFKVTEGRKRLIYPLVVGTTAEVSKEATGQQGVGLTQVWQPLLHTPAYKEAVTELPDTVPLATLTLVDAICRRELGVPLASPLAGATVRQLLLGSSSTDAEQHLPGLLGYDACILEGPVLMLDAVDRGRYVPFVMAQLNPSLHPSASASEQAGAGW